MVEYISDRMLYITLRGRWCDIIVLNVFGATEDKSDDPKDSCYDKLDVHPTNSLRSSDRMIILKCISANKYDVVDWI
jgi:hypothetical protein